MTNIQFYNNWRDPNMTEFVVFHAEIIIKEGVISIIGGLLGVGFVLSFRQL